MTPNDFDFLRDMLKKASGLVLSNEKQYLVESRLAPLSKKLEFSSVGEFVADWRKNQNQAVQKQIVEAMTINESFFFRDKTPFDNFVNVMLPQLIEANKIKKQIRIWSAAASTGQEAYSLAMILKEHASQLQGWRIEIIGTDLCSEALEKGKSGLYSQFEVQRGMPVKYLMTNFDQVGSMWQIHSDIRSAVQFRQFNLLDSFSALGKFDIIFCRNVLIYFDKETKTQILQRMEKQSTDSCFLVLGASETLVALNENYKQVPDTRSLYQLSTGAQKSIAPPTTLRPALSKTGTTGSR